MVGIDGSEESAVALRWAMAQAARRGYSVKLVYALLIPVVSDAYGMVMTRPDVDELAAYSKGLLAGRDGGGAPDGSRCRGVAPRCARVRRRPC